MRWSSQVCRSATPLKLSILCQSVLVSTSIREWVSCRVHHGCYFIVSYFPICHYRQTITHKHIWSQNSPPNGWLNKAWAWHLTNVMPGVNSKLMNTYLAALLYPPYTRPPLSLCPDPHHGTPMLLEGVRCLSAQKDAHTKHSSDHKRIW